MTCTSGFCLDENGEDVNEGVITFPGTGMISKEECLHLCNKKRMGSPEEITACEYRKDIQRCVALSFPVSKGNGRETDICCSYDTGIFLKVIYYSKNSIIKVISFALLRNQPGFYITYNYFFFL